MDYNYNLKSEACRDPETDAHPRLRSWSTCQGRLTWLLIVFLIQVFCSYIFYICCDIL